MAECEVRPFVIGDARAVFELGKQFVSISPVWGDLEPNEDGAYRWLEQFDTALSRTGSTAGWVATYGGEIVAFLGAVIYEKPFLYGLIACDEALYVTPDVRGAGAGEWLVDEYVEWATALGCKKILLCNTTGVDPARTTAFYGKCGFKPIGTNTMLVPGD